MRKGRQKGQTKAKSIISDPLIAPYKITVEEDQYVLLDDDYLCRLSTFNLVLKVHT